MPILTFSFILRNLLQHIREMNDHAIAKQGDTIFQDHSGRQQVEGEMCVTDDYSVPRIVTACTSSYNIHAFWGDQVDKLA